jgi:cobalamin biosynthesis Mg chelatase CobN
LLAISLMAVGTAAALSVSGNAPAPAQNGTDVSMTATIQDPFENAPDQWTLRGDTELESATWTVEAYDQRGNIVTREDATGANVTQQLNFSSGVTRVNVSVSGTVPDLTTFNYENRSAENYTAMSLTQQNGDAVDRTWESHRFTNDSQAARDAIDDAAAAVDNASGSAGQDDLDRAIDAYNNGNFDNAISLAEDAESTAEENTSDGGLPIALIAGAVVVLLVVVGGGVYYWQSQQQDTSRLQ